MQEVADLEMRPQFFGPKAQQLSSFKLVKKGEIYNNMAQLQRW